MGYTQFDKSIFSLSTQLYEMISIYEKKILICPEIMILWTKINFDHHKCHTLTQLIFPHFGGFKWYIIMNEPSIFCNKIVESFSDGSAKLFFHYHDGKA